MAANCIIGQILSIGTPQKLTSQQGQAFTIRPIVISVRRYDPNTGEPVNDYENTPEFSFFGDKCRELDQYKVGQNVCIYFDIVGRKYTPVGGTEKIINDIRPYKIEAYGRTSTQPSAQPTAPANNPQVAAQSAPAVGYPASTPSAQPQAQAPAQQPSLGFNPPI